MSARELTASARAMRVIAALFGFAAVALGAFGAHALRGTLSSLGTFNMDDRFDIPPGARCCPDDYRLGVSGARISFWLFVAGIGLFCGSLYVYAVTGLKPIAMFAPVGGICLLAGWLALALGAGRGR